MNPFILFGGLIEVSTAFPYMRDQLREKTRPAVVSWTTWLILSGLTASAAYASHAYPSAILSGAVAIECFLILVVSFGKWNFVYTVFDGFCQIGALLGIFFWYATTDPVLALVIFVITDAIGAIPILKHAWNKPYEETLDTFSLSIAGNCFVAASVTSFTFPELLVPLYLLTFNTTISTIIIQRRKMIPLPEEIPIRITRIHRR